MYHKKIAIGSVQFGSNYGISNTLGITTEKEVAEIISYCKENSITTIDTAFGYQKSEEVLGRNNLTNFSIISKFLPKSNTIPCVKEQLTISLKRLNIPCLYGYLAHRSIDVVQNKYIWTFLKEAKNNGLIKKIGFSFNEPSEIEAVIEENLIPDIVQVPYNYFDKRFENYIVFLRKQYNVEIHVRSVFLQGLFFADTTILDSFFNPVKDQIKNLQNKYCPLNAYLLNYVIMKDFVDKVVIGINNKGQLIENLEGLKLAEKLPPFQGKIDNSILMPSNWP